MNLSMLKPGEKGKITKIGAIGPLKRRLMDMGVLVGEDIKVKKVAPLGDPIEVTIKNYNLSLRKKGAEGIVVDATNLERNLYLTVQLLELCIPVVIALNMAHPGLLCKG